MAYISTHKESEAEERDGPAEEAEMTREELMKSLIELTAGDSGKITREELFRLLTTTGFKFTVTEAAQALSFIPKEDGWIRVDSLVDMLYPRQ